MPTTPIRDIEIPFCNAPVRGENPQPPLRFANTNGVQPTRLLFVQDDNVRNGVVLDKDGKPVEP